jgi:hypothetical protein
MESTMNTWCKVSIDGHYFKLNSHGEIQRLMKSGNWKSIPNVCNHNNGMNVIIIKHRQHSRSKLMGCVYMGLDINSQYISIYQDKNRMNCHISNLRFVEQK